MAERFAQYKTFDAGKAVRRLLAGEPPKYVFPGLVTITERDLRGRYDIGMAKPVRFTLETAAVLDVAAELAYMPGQEEVFKLPATRQRIEPDPVKPVLVHAVNSILRESALLSVAATDPEGTDTTLSRVLVPLEPFLALPKSLAYHCIRESVLEQHVTTKEFLPTYYLDLLKAYFKEYNNYPTFDQFVNLAKTSLTMLTRRASFGFGYMAASNTVLNQGEGHVIKSGSNGMDRVIVTDEARGQIEDIFSTIFTQGPDDYVINCPANVTFAPNEKGSKPKSLISEINQKVLARLEVA